MYIDCESIYSSSSAFSKTNERKTTKNKIIRYLCFIVVNFIHTCHHRLKMSSFSLKKNKFRSINLTCWRSTQPLRLRFLKALNTSSWNDFGPRATAVILKILHPFKYPGLGGMPPQQMQNSFSNCSPCLLAVKAKVASLISRPQKCYNHRLARWI